MADPLDDALGSLDNPEFRKLATALAVCSLASCVILILPLAAKIRSQNLCVGTVLISMFMIAFFQGINALIWPKYIGINTTVEYDGNGLCDIEVKLFIAFDVAIPGALLCLFRRITRSLKPSRLGLKPSKREQTMTTVLEVFFCIGLPILSMPFSFIVQPGRYYLATIVGCINITEKTLLSYVFVLAWPVAVSFGALIYATWATTRMIKHYHNIYYLFGGSTNATQTRKEIVKTSIFAFVLFCIRTPFAVLTLYQDRSLTNLRPFSWTEVHPEWWSQLVFVLRPTESRSNIYLKFSIVPTAIFAFFCFGFGQDAKEVLTIWEKWLRYAWRKLLNRKAQNIAKDLPESPTMCLVNDVRQARVPASQRPTARGSANNGIAELES